MTIRVASVFLRIDRFRRCASGARALPSIGPMKARSLLAILSKRLGVDLPGMVEMLPSHPTLGDVDSDEALERYQTNKRAHKAALRAQAGA